ncbi:MAG TPA: ubiquinol-cytochrome c reductase cytochrome b subunit [Actinomycetota bacterium]|nr:ubiquinol-cytochrome c reductase cytochrome b subunit [Actinomycetota bacterium]
MIGRLARWFDDRLRASDFAHRALNKVFPDDWSFMLGEIALYSFVVLVLTGTFLTFFFVPSAGEIVYRGAYEPLRGVEVSEAYASVLELSFSVRAGLVMRQTHHWAALVFIGAIVVHLCRVFFTGAFRRPREVNWMIGLTLLLLALFNGFTGYSLPDDLLSGTGLRIAYSVALSIPFVGTWLAFLVFGGEFPTHATIPRLFVAHVFIVPLVLFALVSIHLALIWHQKHTQHAGPGRTETNVVGSTLWPTYAAKSVGLFFAIAAVLGAMGGLLQINPVWLYGPFDAAAVTSPAQPDWYLGWLEGALRLFPPWELRVAGHTVANPFFPGVLLPGVTFLLLYAWPFLEARATGDRSPHHLLDRPRDHPLRTAIGAAGLTFYGLLFLAASNDVVAKTFAVPVAAVTVAFQVLVLVLPMLVGVVTFRLMRRLRDSGAPDLLQVPFRTPVGAAPPEGSAARSGAE